MTLACLFFLKASHLPSKFEGSGSQSILSQGPFAERHEKAYDQPAANVDSFFPMRTLAATFPFFLLASLLASFLKYYQNKRKAVESLELDARSLFDLG